MSRRGIVVIMLAAAAIGIVVTQGATSPVQVVDCRSDFILLPDCLPFGNPVVGAVMDRWLVFWDVGWSDVALAATIAAVLVVAVLSVRALRPGVGQRTG